MAGPLALVCTATCTGRAGRRQPGPGFWLGQRQPDRRPAVGQVTKPEPTLCRPAMSGLRWLEPKQGRIGEGTGTGAGGDLGRARAGALGAADGHAGLGGDS